MIYKMYSKNPACFKHLNGYFYILSARIRVTTRMIVKQHYTYSPVPARLIKHL